jgi:predicted P-loop ATPase
MSALNKSDGANAADNQSVFVRKPVESQSNLEVTDPQNSEDPDSIAARQRDVETEAGQGSLEQQSKSVETPEGDSVRAASDPSVVTSNEPVETGIVAAAAANPAGRVRFRDFYKNGNPKPSLANAVRALRTLGIDARYNLFHYRIEVTYKGAARTIREGLLTDDTVSAARSLINNTFGIDCGDANTLTAIKEIASENAFDPVLDMLLECEGRWDGVKRLDTWVVRYLGCADTALNRAIGRNTLVAAVRRARRPGCKYDTITVLEGDEGTNKSTAIRVLAGDENFSDQSILGASDKEVQEQLEGVWMHENADLAGMKRAEVEHVKAFASRQVDRARPAYGRVREDRPRRSIEWGTTNNEQYLLSQTGNRRFAPLKTGTIDIEALQRDREQLLGEAAAYETAGEKITLDPSLWRDAQAAQEQRRAGDPWEDILANMPDHVVHKSADGTERVASADVLSLVLDIPRAQQTSAHGQRLALAMKHAGWTRNPAGRVMINGQPVRGYLRSAYGATGPTGATGTEATANGATGPTGPTGTSAAQILVLAPGDEL